MALVIGKLLELFQLNRIWNYGNYIYNTEVPWIRLDVSALQIL